jgi:cysteine desulfurase
LDAASGQPLNPAAREAWGAAADSGWADPRRLYRAGRQADLLRQAAREALSQDLGTPSSAVILTATSADLPDRIIDALVPPNGTVVMSAVEHSSVLAAGDALTDRGGCVRLVGVDRLGRVDPIAYAEELPGADLAILQAANHEVGTRQPVADITAACARAEVPLLLDASFSLGHDPVPEGWSILLGDAGSWGGPSGTGLVAVRDPSLRRQLERTLPPAALPSALAAARGWEWAAQHRETQSARARDLTDRILATLTAQISDVLPLGDPVDRLPHLVAFSCLYVDGEALVLGLDRAGYAISSGSSCVSDTRRPSHVLAAMGALTQGNVRVSLPYDVTEETVDGFLDVLPTVVADVRAMLGAPPAEPS